MSLGPKVFSVLPTASPFLLWSSWRVPRILLPTATIGYFHMVIFEFGLAGEMLGRAAKEYHPSLKPDLPKSLIFSTCPTKDSNIEDQLKKSRKPIEPRFDFKNSKTTSQRTRVRSPIFTKSYEVSNPLARISGFRPLSTSESLPAAVSKQESLQSITKSAVMEQKGSITPNFNNPIFEINEDDFDDDDELDLDNNFELPKSQSNPSKPSTKPYLNFSSQNSTGTQNNENPLSQNQPSSIATWSSSPPSHKLNPWLALESMKREAGRMTHEELTEPARPNKRRTLPWLQKEAENNLMSSEKDDRDNERSSNLTQFDYNFSSNLNNHHSEHSLKNEEATPRNFKSISSKREDKKMPWDNAGNTIKEEKKKLKDRRRDSKNNDELPATKGDPSRLQPKLSVIPLSLSEEQKIVLDLVINQSKSVFFTGSAGTGKSVLMRAIIAELRKRYAREADRVAVTASTGLAACNIGGVTLHSFGGIGLGKDDVPTLVRKIKRNSKAKARWIRTKVLIIDEISMVDGDLFDKLEGIARAMRNNGRPFGGIQLVITGDFFQLPPVPEYDNKSRGVKFAFDACTWSTSLHHTIGLTQVFRQKDSEFANMLNEMRLGKITDKTVTAFKSLSREVPSDGIEATELFPTRSEVDNANAFRMRVLHGTSHTYHARDGGTVQDPQFREKLLSNMMAPKSLELKKGAQVMLIKNMDEGLVNGTVGKVRSFMSEKNFKFLEDSDALAQFEYDSEEDTVGNKSQPYEPDLDSRFANKKTSVENSGTLYPYVSFKLSDGTRRMMLILPEEWKIELPNGEVQAQRSQVPLILAWALSIHKAQGQTLQKVKIDLKKVFEKGQAYVALSRATTQAGLQVLNFDKSKVLAHPKVAQFYRSLYDVQKNNP